MLLLLPVASSTVYYGVVEENSSIVVVTAFRVHSSRRYYRHRDNKIARGEWVA